jgi:hypothetical protein
MRGNVPRLGARRQTHSKSWGSAAGNLNHISSTEHRTSLLDCTVTGHAPGMHLTRFVGHGTVRSRRPSPTACEVAKERLLWVLCDVESLFQELQDGCPLGRVLYGEAGWNVELACYSA